MPVQDPHSVSSEKGSQVTIWPWVTVMLDARGVRMCDRADSQGREGGREGMDFTWDWSPRLPGPFLGMLRCLSTRAEFREFGFSLPPSLV